MDKQELIEALVANSSLDNDEAIEFITIIEGLKNISDIAILDEFWDNWSAFDNYDEAWEDEQTYDDEQTEEDFKQHAFILSTGRCIIRDYK